MPEEKIIFVIYIHGQKSGGGGTRRGKVVSKSRKSWASVESVSGV